MATDDTRSYAPEAIAGGLAVLPAANLAIRKKSKHRFDAPHIPMYDDVSMLDKHMQPGDVLVGGYRTGLVELRAALQPSQTPNEVRQGLGI